MKRDFNVHARRKGRMSSTSTPNRTPDTLDARWSVFFVGGRYQDDQGILPMSGQMYVQAIEPAEVTQPFPIIMLHGMAQTGNNYLYTLDGRPGWAINFARRGYRVFVVDQVGCARSGSSTKIYGDYTHPLPESTYRIFGSKDGGLSPPARGHTQWPGEVAVGDPVFDQFMASQVPFITDQVRTEEINFRANLALLERTGPAVVLAHSQAGLFGWKLGDERPDLVRALVSIEPNGPPFYNIELRGGEDWYRYCDGVVRPWGITRIPLRFSPEGPLVIASAPEPAGSERVACFLQAEPARQLPNLAKVPIAIVTGAASFRATVDHGTSRFLSQAGVANTHIRLEEVGLHGNGHMMMMERNSDEIAAVIAEWIERALGRAPAS
jgi:pimeloyl-ACP methyl ester carboxylesterase